MKWEDIKAYLPNGWEEKCTELKALSRSRNIKNAEQLLEMFFTYLTFGESLSQTVAIMATKNISIRKESFFERLQKGGDWLRWLVQNILQSYGMVMSKPQWLGEKDVLLVDGSDISLKGSNGSDYRLHMMFDLFNFCYKSLEITPATDGEKINKFKPTAKSIIIGDRGYVSTRGIEYILEQKTEFIFRYRSRAFNLYDKNGKKIDLTKNLDMGEWAYKDINCYYLYDGKLKPLRVCLMKKDERAIASSERKLKKLYSKKQIQERQPDTMMLNEYIILCTNLDCNTENIFELYRCRWQIELVFKELKTTLSFGNIPSSNPKSVKSWFYGKLLIAALSLLIVNESHFSPKG